MRNKTLSVFICAYMLVGLSAPLLFSSNEPIIADTFRDESFLAPSSSHIWHDDCSNVTGWTNHTEWDGYTRWGTASGTMASDGDAIHCPTNSGWDTGPFWFKGLTVPFPSEEFARWDFQVSVNQSSGIYKGDLWAGLLDDEKQPVMVIQLLSWDDLNDDLYIYLHYRCENGTWLYYERPDISIPNFDGVCSFYHESGIGLIGQIGTEGSGVIVSEDSWNSEPARNITYVGIQWRAGSGTYLDYFVHDIVVEQGYEDTGPGVIVGNYTWHDDCSNTTDWTNHTEWGGYTEWATASGTLESDGDAIYCPANSGFDSGPFWFKEFPARLSREEFARWDFQVNVTQPSVSYKGDIMACLYDDAKLPVFAVHFHSWDDLDSNLYINLHYCNENGTSKALYSRPSVSNPDFDGVCSIYYESGIGLVAQIGTEGSGLLISEEEWNLEPARNISYIGIQWRRGSGTYLDYFVHDIVVQQGSVSSDLVIDSPPDITYEYGTTGNNITWTPSSASPSHYEIYQNLALVASGPWNGSQISISVDGLDPGIYIYYIFVYSDTGYFAFDWVLVTVNEATTSTTTITTTTTTTPMPMEIMIMTIAVGAGAIIVVVAALMCRSRGAEGALPTGQSGYHW